MLLMPLVYGPRDGNSPLYWPIREGPGSVAGIVPESCLPISPV